MKMADDLALYWSLFQGKFPGRLQKLAELGKMFVKIF